MKKRVSNQNKEYNKKLRAIKTLANKALKEGVKLKCSPGRKFLEDVSIGKLVKCGNSEGIVYKKTDSSVMVIVTKHNNSFTADAFYLGERRWATTSEVEVLDWKQKINGKKVYGLGASTKGNVLLQYFNIKEDLLKYIGEVNQDKLNSFTPGTYIPMISENEAIKLKPDYFLILPWHFKSFFINSKKFSGKKLVFPLPFFKIVKVK